MILGLREIEYVLFIYFCFFLKTSFHFMRRTQKIGVILLKGFTLLSKIKTLRIAICVYVSENLNFKKTAKRIPSSFSLNQNIVQIFIGQLVD